jgi:hypothetical protein
MTGDDCSVNLDVQSSCEYAGSRCVCNGYIPASGGAGGAGGAPADTPGSWFCQGEGDTCPDPAPMTDDNCDNNGDLCPYPGGITCTCGGNNWNCVDPSAASGGAGNTPDECPEVEPGDGDDCVGPVATCFYDDSNTICQCPGVGDSEWSCNGL